MKKWMKGVALVAGMMMLLPAAACGNGRDSQPSTPSGDTKAEDITIGVSMPSQQLERWNKDGANLKQQLEDKGYKVILQFADDKVDQQASQIQNMANQGAQYLIVAAIDGTAVGPAVEAAKENGATVIAYDRLIMNTDAVDYYATFNLEDVGHLQGQYIVQALGLDQGKKGPFNIELMTGDPADNNAKFFYSGAWAELEPYFKSGALVSPSGKVPETPDDYQSIGIQNWDTQKAMDEMQNRINSYYTDGKHLDAVLSPNDSLALGTINAINAAGWDYYPIITGQDADTPNVPLIVKGEQAMTVFKDTRQLADATAQMVVALINGETPTTDSTFDNGNKTVPSQQLKPVIVTKDNVQSALVDSGYISAEDAGL
jgi:putative multiple sugar transport system substrate-binding protein